MIESCANQPLIASLSRNSNLEGNIARRNGFFFFLNNETRNGEEFLHGEKVG